MDPLLLAAVALHTLVIYLFLVFAIPLLGRRQLGQLSALDFLVLLLLGSAVETAMVCANTSLRAGLVSATVLLLANKAVNAVMLRSKHLRHVCGVSSLLLVHNGKFVTKNLLRAGFTENDVFEALREREFAKLEDVRYAVLEPNGEVHVVPMSVPTLKSAPSSPVLE